MFKRIVREIAVFIFSTGLVFYVLYFCFINFLIDLFLGTNIAKLLFLIQKKIDEIIIAAGRFIIKKLEEKDMWY